MLRTSARPKALRLPILSQRSTSGSWRKYQNQPGTTDQSRSLFRRLRPASAIAAANAAQTPRPTEAAAANAAALSGHGAWAKRFMPDLDQAKAAVAAFDMDDQVDQRHEQVPDVVAMQLAPGLALLHQQHQLLEGELRGIGVDGGDRPGVPGVDVAQVEVGRSVAQFLQKDPVGPHPQRALEELARTDTSQSLAVLGV